MGAHAPPVAHGRLPAACVCRDAKPGLVGRRGPPRRPRLPHQPPTTLFPVRSSLAPAQPERSPGPPWDPASRDMTRTCSLYSATGALLIRRGGGALRRLPSQWGTTTRNDLGAMRVNATPKKGGGAARPTGCLPVAGFDWSRWLEGREWAWACLALEQEKAWHPMAVDDRAWVEGRLPP